MERVDNSLATKKHSPVPSSLPRPLRTIYRPKWPVKNGLLLGGQNYAPTATSNSWDRLFDEAYRADVLIHTDNGGVIHAHASILGNASPALKCKLKQERGHGGKRSISIFGVPHEAVRVFVRFLYSSCYEQVEMEENALPLLVLSHAYVVPNLKRVCELQLEQRLITTESVIDIFQLALLCDAPRLSLICHRFILNNFKAVAATEGWNVMKKSHPMLEKELLESLIDEDTRRKEKIRKSNEREVYLLLYEAMEALVHICRDGCRTIGPCDKILNHDEAPCNYEARRGLESLARHFARCKLRVSGSCVHCKRMWQLLELHSRLCAVPDACRVPLCSNFKRRMKKQNKKEDMKWRILVRKMVRTKSISGAPFFTLISA